MRTARRTTERMASRMVMSPHKQRGLSVFGVLIILSIASFLGLFAFKVGPSYFEYMTVSSITDDLADNKELMSKSKTKIMNAVALAYRANNLWELKPEESILLQKDADRGYILTVDYEKRANLFSNIDVVTKFNRVAGSAP